MSSSPGGCWRRSRPRRSRSRSLPLTRSRTDARARLALSSYASSARPTKPPVRSGRSTRASRRTAWSLAASRPAGSTKLHELAEAEAELAEQTRPAPEPSREQIEQLARELPKLWAAESTSEKDRKRLLRALIADITLTSRPDSRELQVGIRWRSGATEQHTVQRPLKPADAKRTPSEVIELITQLAPDHTNTQIAEQLDTAGMRTSTGLPFDEKAVRWLRWRYQIGPSQPRDGRTHRHRDRQAVRRLRRHRLRLDLRWQARRPPRARQPALHPIRSRRPSRTAAS